MSEFWINNDSTECDLHSTIFFSPEMRFVSLAIDVGSREKQGEEKQRIYCTVRYTYCTEYACTHYKLIYCTLYKYREYLNYERAHSIWQSHQVFQ